MLGSPPDMSIFNAKELAILRAACENAKKELATKLETEITFGGQRFFNKHFFSISSIFVSSAQMIKNNMILSINFLNTKNNFILSIAPRIAQKNNFDIYIYKHIFYSVLLSLVSSMKKSSCRK